MTTSQTLTEFLEARIRDDETFDWPDVQLRSQSLRARMEKEAEGKRRIVELSDRSGDPTRQPKVYEALVAAAIPYVDHPDFQKSWITNSGLTR